MANPGYRQPSGQPSGIEVFHGCPLPMLLVDAPSGRIVDANLAVLRLLGYRSDELRGMPLQSLNGGSGSGLAEHLFFSGTVGQGAARHRALRARDGSILPVEVRSTRWGESASFVSLYLRDARPDEEARLERGDLQAQLWTAQRQESVGRMAGGVAHDLNNLLSMILLTTQSLSSDLGEDVASHAGLLLIGDATLRARELTTSLLAFSDSKLMEPRVMSLNEVVVAMEGMLRRTVPESIELTFRLERRDTLVEADPGQMQQVLVNLVLNAWEAMPDGGQLTVSTEAVDLDEEAARKHASLEPGPHVLLTVTDTGTGMDEETRSQIFDPLFSTRGREVGRGLGLPTVQGIVQRSGGSVWVASQPGFGTAVGVHLPRLRGPAVPLQRAERAKTMRMVPRGSEHVLLVEDDDRVRAVVEGLLQDLGYRVTATPSPEAAIALHDDLRTGRGVHPVDILLTDIVMPGMSGHELAQRLRVKRDDLKVLFMSGYLDPEVTRDPRSGGPFLAKPFTRAELAARMRAVLEGPGSSAMGARS